MAIVEIEIWLNSKRNYQEGIKLYELHGTNSLLKKVFQLNQSTFNSQKLLLELIAINSIIGVKPAKRELPIQKQILTGAELNVLPADVREIHSRGMQLFKINAKRQAEIYAIVKEGKKIFGKDISKVNTYLAERNVPDSVNVMLDTRDEIGELFYQVDYFNVHKKLPETIAMEKAETIDRVVIKQQLLNIRSRISKLKKARGSGYSKEGNTMVTTPTHTTPTFTTLTTQKENLERRLDGLI